MEEILSLTRMARRLNVPKTWLREQAAAGEIPAIEAGARWLFNPAVVEQVLAERVREMAEGGDNA